MSIQNLGIRNQILSGVPIRTVFMGTPDFAIPSLEAIAKIPSLEVVGVFTQPDHPIGRKQKLHSSAIKQAAQNRGLPVFTPAKLRDPETIDLIKNIAPDLIIVVAYGQIVPKAILDLPRYGAINVHGSLLPKYRGASPLQAAIAAGETETGITIMLMDEWLDHGPILAQKNIPIASGETGESLFEKMATIGASLLAKTIPNWIAGKIKPIEQRHDEATATKILTREDGRINWRESAEVIERKMRAYHPWPGTWTLWTRNNAQIRLSILQAEAMRFTTVGSIGTVFTTNSECLVQCGIDALALKMVRMEGKREMPIREFLNGYPELVGSILE